MGRMPLRNFSLFSLLLLPLVNPEAISSDVLSFGPESDLDRFLPAGVLDVVSPQCRKDFRRFLRSAQSEFWAIKMMDAQGSYPQAGIGDGNRFVSLGAYYSCLEVDPSLEDPDLDFRGQYCHIFGFPTASAEGGDKVGDRGFVEPLFPPFVAGNPFFRISTFFQSLGICVPSSCSKEEVASALGLASVVSAGPTLRTSLSPIHCRAEDVHPEVDGADISYIILASIFIILIVAGTALDLFRRKMQQQSSNNPKDSEVSKWLLGFSSYTNSLRLFDTSPPRGDQIGCLDGIRFWSMCWVLVSHCYSLAQFDIPLHNTIYITTEFQASFWFRAILNGFPSVDSFFIIGGCLLGYLTFKELERTKGRFNVPMFYLHRYLRITGVYAMVIGFFATIFKFFTWGPNNPAEGTVNACRASWWTNLLYINNFYELQDDGVCLGQTWYLATEFQMFIFSPTMFLPMWWLWKKRNSAKLPMVFATLYLTFFTVVVLIMSIVKEWPIDLIVTGSNEADYSGENYVKPWIRCQPYIIGIALGFILHITKKKKIRMSRILNLAIWCLAWAVGLAIMYGLDANEYIVAGEEPSLASRVIFNTFHRIGWGLALGWLIFACFHGYGGYINTFLSWECFRPLGRLSFNVYLVHYQLIPLIYGQITYEVVGTHIFVVIMLLSVFIASNLFAVILSVGIEIPLASCEKLLFASLLGAGRGKKEGAERKEVEAK